jgi:glucosamine--fructose-6-phosphate aminotransferase (isomerizing)
MCGIVGATAERNVLPILLEGLKRLEYRGYDSAGVALTNQKGLLKSVKESGKVQTLIDKIKKQQIEGGSTGIAHTRWATHGKPTKTNAHPHLASDRIAVVHNGIIENFAELKSDLHNQGVHFSSGTDTEVIAHLIDQYWTKDSNGVEAIQKVIQKLKGAYGLVALNKDDPQKLIAVRSGSPIVIGYGIEENFVASDSLSLFPVTRYFSYLNEGEIAEITRQEVTIYDANGVIKQPEIKELSHVDDAAYKGNFRHYMQKEIYQQPEVVAATFENCISDDGSIRTEYFGPEAYEIFTQIEHVRLVACGTSYHAGLVAKYWLESIAEISCDVDIASEFRYRSAIVPSNCLFVAISQSGETADTLAALKQAKQKGYDATMGICNVANSSLVREADCTFLTKAGIEMGVASTKAFTTQLVALLLLTCAIAQTKNKKISMITQSLQHVPEVIKRVLNLDHDIANMAKYFIEMNHTLFLGRGIHYPVALEGALKLKEISYIHAEAYPSGELKHGPLALVDKDMPIIAVAPNDHLIAKLEGNLQEVKARGGQLYVFIDKRIYNRINVENAQLFNIGETLNDITGPIVFTIPLQLLAYHVAVQKGTDVDQPRNLAKSVTVE